MNNQSVSHDNENELSKQDKCEEISDANKIVSEEEGLKSAEKIFNDNPNDILDEEKEFLRYLKFLKKAKDLGILNESHSTSFYYQGGIHLKDSNLQSHGNIVGNDQNFSFKNSNLNGFLGETTSESCKPDEFKPVDLIFDECKDIRQRSFMLVLAVLNGCNYRIVLEASERLQAIIQPSKESEYED